MSDNDNGSSVTQREFGRSLDQIHQDFAEIKTSIRELHVKVDINTKSIVEAKATNVTLRRLESKIEFLSNKVQGIFEQEIPRINQQTLKLDSRTKTIWSVVIGGVTLAANLIVYAAKSFFGL